MTTICGFTVVDADKGERFATTDWPFGSSDADEKARAEATATGERNRLALQYGKEFCLEVWGIDQSGALVNPAPAIVPVDDGRGFKNVDFVPATLDAESTWRVRRKVGRRPWECIGDYATFDAAMAAHPTAKLGVDENGNGHRVREGIAAFEKSQTR